HYVGSGLPQDLEVGGTDRHCRHTGSLDNRGCPHHGGHAASSSPHPDHRPGDPGPAPLPGPALEYPLGGEPPDITAVLVVNKPDPAEPGVDQPANGIEHDRTFEQIIPDKSDRLVGQARGVDVDRYVVLGYPPGWCVHLVFGLGLHVSFSFTASVLRSIG